MGRLPTAESDGKDCQQESQMGRLLAAKCCSVKNIKLSLTNIPDDDGIILDIYFESNQQKYMLFLRASECNAI